MKYWYQDPYAMFILIVFFFGYLAICYWTASYHARRRVFDIQLGVGLCLFLSPLIGGIILSFFPNKEPRDLSKIKVESINQRFSEPVSKKRIKPLILKKAQKAFFYAIVGILFVLAITNPGLNRFKEYTPDQKTSHHYVLWKRSSNFLFFSIYELSSYDQNQNQMTFVSLEKQNI